jgi:hypothetical protein
MDDTFRRGALLSLPAWASARIRAAPTVLASALLALATGGCEPSTFSDTAIRTDSAGVMLVEYPSLPPIEASRIAIAAEPDLVLGAGGTFAGPDHEFFEITGVSQLRDGRLVVANAGSHELRIYGADGQFLRSGGREGDGPGEFRDLWVHRILAGDTIVAWDRIARRLQYFGPEGGFVRSTSTVAAPSAEFAGRSEMQDFLEDGRLIVFIPSTLPPTMDVPERQPLLVALHRIDEGEWDSIRVLPGPTMLLSRVSFGGETMVESKGYAFGGYPVAAGAGATLAVADNAHFRVEMFDPDGRLVSILSASVPDILVTDDVLEAQVEHLVAHAGVTGSDLARYRERMEESVRTNHAPVLPAIRAIFVDADERIWVERFDVPGSGPSRWEVFERDGTWIGRVEMPEGFARGRRAWASWAPGFSVAGGRLAGVWTDPVTGVETVRVYRVIELGS